MGPMESIKVRLKIPPVRMAFLKFVLEAWDHLALMKTLSTREGEVLILIPPGREEEWEALWKDLKAWL